MTTYFLVIFFFFSSFQQVICLPVQTQHGLSLMDQLYDEIQGYVNKKRNEIGGDHAAFLSEDSISAAEIKSTSLDAFPSAVDDTIGNEKGKKKTKSFIEKEKSPIEKELVNVTVKIPIFQASDKTKHLSTSSTGDKALHRNSTVQKLNNNHKNSTRNVKLMNITNLMEDMEKNTTTSVEEIGKKNETLETIPEMKGNHSAKIQKSQLTANSTEQVENNTMSIDANSTSASGNISADRELNSTENVVSTDNKTNINDNINVTVFSESEGNSLHDEASGDSENSELVLKNPAKNDNSSPKNQSKLFASLSHDSNHNDVRLDVENFSGDQENGTSLDNTTSTEVRTKRHYYWDHNQNQLEMHNNPVHYGGDFMHGGGHDEFHSIDENGQRVDLGRVDFASEPNMNYHHDEPHFHHYEPHSEYTDIHNEPQYYSQQVHHEPHYHRSYYHDEPHFQHQEHHFHDNHQDHYHNEPHYLHNEVHIHHNHENFHDDSEERHHSSGDWSNYHQGKFHHVKVKLHGPGKTPEEWHDQEREENMQMPVGENDELNNYDTGAGFFQLDENGGDVEVTSMHKTGTKVHMGGGQFSIIRDPWRYHSAFAGMFHPHESFARIGGLNNQDGGGIQQFHQHFTYINNNRNENHKVQNLVHHQHEPEHDHHEHHYEEHHDDHHQHHDHLHHGDVDGDDGDHDDDHHHHHHEEDEDHHHYEEHRLDDHQLTEHPDGDHGYQRHIKLYPGDDVKSSEQETGTPTVDNMREDRTPSASKRTSDNVLYDVSAITPTEAKVPNTSSDPLKRNEVENNPITPLEDQINYNGPKNAFFKGIQHENEAMLSGDSSGDELEVSGDSSDVQSFQQVASKKMKTTFDDHAQSKQPDILNIQQFHVNGPSNPEPWVTRELIEPISPMVVKRQVQRKDKRSGLKAMFYRKIFRSS